MSARTRSAESTRRDQQMLEALTLKIRILTAEQAGAAWWPGVSDAVNAARARLENLSAAGLVAQRSAFAHRMLDLSGPLLRWCPGEPLPTDQTIGAVAYQLKSRWPDAPPTRTTVYAATPKLANRLGGFDGRLHHRDQVDHDLHVTHLYLRALRDEPRRAEAWRGEELHKPDQEYGEKLPDAVLVDHDGHPFLAVEFGGRYSKGRVKDFIQHCVDRALAFEIW